MAFLLCVVVVAGVASHLDIICHDGTDKVVLAVKAGITRAADTEFMLGALLDALEFRQLDDWCVCRLRGFCGSCGCYS